MADITIDQASLLEEITGSEKIPVGNGSGNPATVSINQILEKSSIQVIDHGTGDTTFVLPPNEFHKWGTIESLSIELGEITNSSIYNEYMFEFVSGATATTLTLPASIKWLSEPQITTDTTYQCSIVNNIGLIIGV